MENKNQLKAFRCNIHTSEQIQRVCLEPNVETSLRCIECILSNTEKVPKDSIVTLKDFIEHATRQYETFRTISRLEESAPNNLIEFLSSENESVEKLSYHIEKEKEKVGEAFNNILQEFTLLCHSKKEEIFRQLDKQVLTLKLNYNYYKSKIDKYYNKDKEDELNPDKETLVHRINNCHDTNEVEVLVKNIKDDILEASTYKDPKVKMNEIKEGINGLAQELKKQSTVFPKSSFEDYSTVESSVKKFKDAISPLMEEFTTINEQIYEFSLSQATFIDSKILKKAEDVRLLKKWISPSGNAKFKLLYRGTRDGMDVNSFHKKCDDVEHTLTIIRSNYGKICGGYSDQKWNLTNNYKQSAKTWLFSIDEKQKFPIKQANVTYATYSNAGYGPTFGGGHDLYICLTGSNGIFGGGGQQCYSNLGHSYECGNTKNNQQKQSILAGAYNFSVEEIEIYAIDTKGTANFSQSDSESVILNPKTDLNLVKNWIARGKNIELDLLYRGSRDGFYAKDFHERCDNKGATLVVCKSATYEKVFGGYTSKDWGQIEDYVSDKDAFLFSVSNSTKHTITNADCAIFCSAEAGPVFGAGYDLFICSNCNVVEDSSSTLGMTFKASDNMGDLTAYLGGNSNFMLEEVEVFKVNIK